MSWNDNIPFVNGSIMRNNSCCFFIGVDIIPNSIYFRIADKSINC